MAISELELYDRKWFDYRHLTPDQATLLFMRAYAIGFANWVDRLDTGRGVHFNLFKKFNAFNIAYIKERHAGFWINLTQLRQWADLHGMEYGEYWSLAFKAHLDLGFRVSYLNAFKNKRLKARILEKFKEQRAAHIKKSASPMFGSNAYQGYEIQDDYYHYLIGSLMERYPQHRQIEITKRWLAEGTMAQDFLLRKSYIKHLFREVA